MKSLFSGTDEEKRAKEALDLHSLRVCHELELGGTANVPDGSAGFTCAGLRAPGKVNLSCRDSCARSASAEDQKKHSDFVERMVERGYTEKQVRLLSEWYLRVRKSQ